MIRAVLIVGAVLMLHSSDPVLADFEPEPPPGHTCKRITPYATGWRCDPISTGGPRSQSVTPVYPPREQMPSGANWAPPYDLVPRLRSAANALDRGTRRDGIAAQSQIRAILQELDASLR